jgi:hypothetical protein
VRGGILLTCRDTCIIASLGESLENYDGSKKSIYKVVKHFPWWRILGLPSTENLTIVLLLIENAMLLNVIRHFHIFLKSL